MNVLVFGDSQSGNTGRKIQDLLKGEHSVTRVTKSGKSTSYLADYAKNNIKEKYDRVFLFNGGNDSSVQSQSFKNLLDHFEGTDVVYMGLPPATTITNVPLAKKVWGSATPHKFFPQTAKKRETKNDAYKQIANSKDWVHLFDFRDAPVSNAIKQPSGVVYPSQPDGIHTSGNTAWEVARWAIEGKANTGGDGRVTPTPNKNLILAAGAAIVAFLYWKSK